MEVSSRQIKGCKPSARYQRYYNRINLLYWDGRLPHVRVYTAPLLKITTFPQYQVLTDENIWLEPGEYGLLGNEENGDWCMILDHATSIYHSILTKQTCIHEANHLDLLPYMGHGIKFKKGIRRVAALGALDGLI